MCGRYVIAKTSSDLLFEFDAGGELEWEPAYSVAPTNAAPILRQHEGEREFQIAKWGFRPSWAKAGGPPKLATTRSPGNSLQVDRWSHCRHQFR